MLINQHKSWSLMHRPKAGISRHKSPYVDEKGEKY